MKKILVENCTECPCSRLWCKRAVAMGISPDCTLPDEDEVLVATVRIGEIAGTS